MVYKNIFQITALTAALILVGCGGGGSDGYYNSGNNTGNGGNSGGSTVVEEVNISPLTLYDVNGNTTNVVTTEGVTAKVKVTDANSNGIAGALVSFSSEGVTFGTTNNSVLTNVDGEASITVKPADSNATGAYQISATVNHDGKSATTSPYNFQLQAVNIALIDMVAASTSLETGGSTNITLKTQDANSKVNRNNVTINFSASCGTFEPVSVVSSNQGDVTTSYKAIDASGQLCEGKQTITATGSDANVTKAIDVNIAAIEPNSIVYTSGTVNLGILQSGSASSGQIEFTLYANGVPAANKDVLIDLVRAPEDLSFISFGNRLVKTVKSDPSGKVVVTLYPGDKPGPVEIRATLASNNRVFALSKNIAISTGRATQNGLSLSVSKNALQNKIDGDTATITARMVDRVGNPVPNGTVISFIAEGGSVTPNCATSNGACSVTLTTQDPRPLDQRVTVLAYVEGDKQYIDKNGNNVYDQGEELAQVINNKTVNTNIGSFFRDDNENLKYDVGEFFYKREGGTEKCAVSTFKQPNIDNTCDMELSTVIREQLLFAFSGNTPIFTNIRAKENLLSFYMYGNSELSVPMPTGTTISVTPEDNTENEKSCSAELLSGSSPVANIFNLLTPTTFKGTSQVYYGYRLKDCAVDDMFKVSVTAPDGKVSSIYVNYQ